MTSPATFDRPAFGRCLRRALTLDGRGYRALADVIGVTVTDLSRCAAGRPVGVEKIFACADWIGVDPRNFYQNNVLRSASRETFSASRGAPDASHPAAPAGRRTTDGVRSDARPAAAEKGKSP